MGGIVGWFRCDRIQGRRRGDAAVLLVWFAAAVLECGAFASGLPAVVVVIALATVVIEVVIRRRRRRRDGADKLVARLIGARCPTRRCRMCGPTGRDSFRRNERCGVEVRGAGV